MLECGVEAVESGEVSWEGAWGAGRGGWPVGGETGTGTGRQKTTYATLGLFGVDSSSELAATRRFLGETPREV